MREAAMAPGSGAAEDVTRPVELWVRGMTCAACAARVEKKLTLAGRGVLADVSYGTGRATVTAPRSVPEQALIAAVEAAGYAAEIIAPSGSGDRLGARQRDDEAEVARLRRRLLVALIFFMPLSDLSITLSLIPGYRFTGWQWLLVGLTVPVAGWAAWPFHRAAFRSIRRGACSMDTLVSLGVIAACGWSVYAMFRLDRGPAVSATAELMHASGGGIYLEVAAAVTTFLLAGRCYEARARASAGTAMRALAATAAQDACVLGADGTERHVPAGLLRCGDTIVIRPGATIAADGEVVSGESAVDRSMMTGESVPVPAVPGNRVLAGTIVISGRLVVRVTGAGQDTQLAHLIRLVDRAQADKAAIQRLADRISSVFVPLVLLAAVLTLAGWLLAGAATERSVSAALAVLIIACPCALGLATPAALVTACGRGARLGIFIKGHQALESSGLVDTVVLDKTGTLTSGRMELAGVAAAAGISRTEVLRRAGALEHASEHAIAAAISTAAAAEVGPLPEVAGFLAMAGLGAAGTVDGQEIVAGQEKLLRDRGLTIPAGLAGQDAAWRQAGLTTVWIGWDGAVRGVMALASTIKPSARAAVAQLRRLGLRPLLLTGDHVAAARAAASAVGIDEVIAGVLPAAKAGVIADLRAQGHRVAMVGDGVNDAPALAAADLGLAMGTGTDVAISASDLILLTDDLTAVPTAIALARATRATIRRNLAWAFGYNLAALPVAAAGFLNPLLAAAAMAMSSVVVVGNSLRLRQLRLVTAEDSDAGATVITAPDQISGQGTPCARALSHAVYDGPSVGV
jgi:cation-transporting P-type ATPase A/B/Cu+-exporting ATPase